MPIRPCPGRSVLVRLCSNWPMLLIKHLALLSSRQQHVCAPRLNAEDSEQRWLQAPGAPYPALPDEHPPGRTLPYQEALHAWD